MWRARQAFYVNDDGIQFLGASTEPLAVGPIEEVEPIWPPA